jgi:hypothetical protein
MVNFCVSLTTIPSRIREVSLTIDSLINQTKKPEKIFLNIPYKYERFPEQVISTEYLEKLRNLKNLEITRCEDFGPGTKLLGSINNLEKYSHVVLVDDDHVYQKDMFEIFFNEALKKPDNAYSFCVYEIEDLKVGQGADGFMINTNYLKNIILFFNNYVKKNKSLFFNDDLWISIYLNKFLNVEIESLNKFLKKRFFSGNKSIYKKHTTIDALIELYEKDRKKARNLRHQESFLEYNMLKKITNNFSNIKF